MIEYLKLIPHKLARNIAYCNAGEAMRIIIIIFIYLSLHKGAALQIRYYVTSW